MWSRKAPLFATLLGAFVAVGVGCGSSVLPDEMVGSYSRRESDAMGVRTIVLSLQVTATGMAVTGPAMGASQSVSVGGTPVLGGSIKMGPSGSALFKTVRCSNGAECRFTTEGCEGTISKEASGSVMVVAVGECEGWSGKWEKVKEGESPVATGASEPPKTSGAAEPPSVAGEPTQVPGPSAVPTATNSGVPTVPTGGVPSAVPSATASGSASVSTSGAATDSEPKPANVSCALTCNNVSFACLQDCKIGEMKCIQTCNEKGMACLQKCP